MKVLITGHRGYIGAHAIDVFQARGHHVMGVDIGLYDGVEFGEPKVADEDLTMDVFDITPEMRDDILENGIPLTMSDDQDDERMVA